MPLRLPWWSGVLLFWLLLIPIEAAIGIVRVVVVTFSIFTWGGRQHLYKRLDEVGQHLERYMQKAHVLDEDDEDDQWQAQARKGS